MPSDAILRRLLALHPKVIDLSLDRLRRLLDALGNPERRLPPVIHVAGTNGKGSLVAYLRAMHEAAGKSVHVYTSPHLVRFHERIRVAGKLIAEDALSDLLTRCEALNEGHNITFFEATTAAAFLAFAETPADMLLLEVGLGGRLDATNVVDRPVLTAITPVSLDHQQFLGDTVELIAAEKAGIIKPGVPCVVGPQMPAAAGVIAAEAAKLGAPLVRHGHEWTVTPTAAGFRWDGPGGTLDLPRPALPGHHQIENAGSAVACARTLGTLDDRAIAAGIARVEWPARLQRLTRGPLVERLGPGAELWLDGGHNPAAGEILAAHFAGGGDRKLHLIAGMLNTKDATGFFRPLQGIATDVQTVAIPEEANSLPPDVLAGFARAAGLEARVAPSVEAAMAAIPPGPSRVLICGSLYLAGTVLSGNN